MLYTMLVIILVLVVAYLIVGFVRRGGPGV